MCVRWFGNSQGHSRHRIPVGLRLSLFVLSLKVPWLEGLFSVMSGFESLWNLPSYFLKLDIVQSREVGGLAARLGSLYVFLLTGLRQRCFLFPQVLGKCAVSMAVRLISLQRCQCLCVQAWGYGATSVALWVQTKHEVGEGMAVVLRGTITCVFKHIRTDMSAGSLLPGTGKQNVLQYCGVIHSVWLVTGQSDLRIFGNNLKHTNNVLFIDLKIKRKFLIEFSKWGNVSILWWSDLIRCSCFHSNKVFFLFYEESACLVQVLGFSDFHLYVCVDILVYLKDNHTT